MRIIVDRVVVCSVVCHKEGPAPPVTVIRGTAVQHIAVEEESITRFTLGVHQGAHFLDMFYPF